MADGINYSRYQFAVLRVLARGGMTMEQARLCKDSTLHSIIRRKWAARQGDFLVLTPAGLEALEGYTLAEPPTRIQERELTDRTARLLRYARSKVVPMKGERVA